MYIDWLESQNAKKQKVKCSFFFIIQMRLRHNPATRASIKQYSSSSCFLEARQE